MAAFLTELVVYGIIICTFTAFCQSPSCKLPIDVGRICNFSTLAQSMKRLYFFDAERNCCSSFSYLGCGGNDNKFFSLGRCLKACLPLDYEDYEQAPNEDDAGRTRADCKLRPEPGPCRALIPMHYYDPEKGECSQFSYGGCQGNLNRFTGKEECIGLCKGAENEIFDGNNSTFSKIKGSC